MVGGVPPQSIREDTRIKELHQMPEYGIDAIFALYESKCILVGVALRPPPVADKGSKALSEITSNRKHIYVQRIATIFQTVGFAQTITFSYFLYMQRSFLHPHLSA